MVLVEMWLMGELALVLEASMVEDPERIKIALPTSLHKMAKMKAIPVGVWGCEGHWGVCDQYEGEGKGVLVAPQ